MTWDRTSEEICRQMALEGKSSPEIACVLSRTKNSIIGKIHRKKWVWTGAAERQFAGHIHRHPRIKKPLPQFQEVVPMVDTPKRAKPLTIWKLKSHSCRWPLGDIMAKAELFCGEIIMNDAVPYCREHCAKAYAVRR